MAKQVAHVTADDVRETSNKSNAKRKRNSKNFGKPVQQHKKEIQQEIMESTIKPISGEAFKKTKQEKELIKSMKKLYKKSTNK